MCQLASQRRDHSGPATEDKITGTAATVPGFFPGLPIFFFSARRFSVAVTVKNFRGELSALVNI
jgi:hypothetical protein